MGMREDILNNSRIILMTPDVCHAWLMSSLANPIVMEFIRNIGLLILDEAHTFEGVFGSNFAFLFRRIQTVRNSLLSSTQRNPLKVIAATATIDKPADHLHQLTGLNFSSIEETQNGSPQFERGCVHIAAPLGQEMSIARNLQIKLLAQAAQGSFISFVDSRKGVEALAISTNAELNKILPHYQGRQVLPYRAGFDSEDRRNIEKSLKKGELGGVISTSALELGIDISSLQVGMNIGVPATKKSFRQRLGRIGRSSPGFFIVIAEHNAFTKYGSNFQEYYQASVEPSYLYLDNRFMHFAHAKCLNDELDSIRTTYSKSTKINWPDGFEKILSSVRPGGNYPREFDAIASLGVNDSPQRAYPLRNIGELNFKIGLDPSQPIGEATLLQALRECYPGATYYHLAQPYRVVGWQAITNPFIKIYNLKGAKPTKPRIRTWINADLTHAGLVDNRLRTSKGGFLAECNMQVTERVEGYEDENGYHSYRDLQQNDQRMRPRMRQFRTTGVLLRIQDGKFRTENIKQFTANILSELFCREYSILPQDIGAAATNITIVSPEGNKPYTDCVVIFDQTYGSLRLTERVYSNFSLLIDRLARASQTAAADEQEKYVILTSLLSEFNEYAKSNVSGEEIGEIIFSKLEKDISIQVFARGSKVGFCENRAYFSEVEIIQPAIIDYNGNLTLMYQVKFRPRYAHQNPTVRYVNAKDVEPLGDEAEWSYAMWNPNLQEYVQDDFET